MSPTHHAPPQRPSSLATIPQQQPLAQQFNPMGMFGANLAGGGILDDGGGGSRDFVSMGGHPALAQWLQQQSAAAAAAAAAGATAAVPPSSVASTRDTMLDTVAGGAGDSGESPHSPMKDEPISPRQGSSNSGGSDYATL